MGRFQWTSRTKYYMFRVCAFLYQVCNILCVPVYENKYVFSNAVVRLDSKKNIYKTIFKSFSFLNFCSLRIII